MAYYLAIDQFQSTRPRGARQGGRAGQLDGDICFNPRARVGRDGTSPWLLDGVPGVSIHAPAWGATSSTKGARRLSYCFNPRARVGRDVARFTAREYMREFQSTRPRGARRRQACRKGHLARVSIHAPAWGATTESTRILARAVSFNPRARVGRDGARRAVAVRPGCFNPRARVGRDVSTAGD